MDNDATHPGSTGTPARTGRRALRAITVAGACLPLLALACFFVPPLHGARKIWIMLLAPGVPGMFMFGFFGAVPVAMLFWGGLGYLVGRWLFVPEHPSHAASRFRSTVVLGLLLGLDIVLTAYLWAGFDPD